MLLTGMYPDQNGLTTNCRNDRDVQLKTDAVCITDVFAQAGYNVSYFGKCHWKKTEPLFDTNGHTWVQLRLPEAIILTGMILMFHPDRTGTVSIISFRH